VFGDDDSGSFLPHLVHLSPDGDYVDSWGGDDQVPAVDGVPQWPSGPDGLDCDDDGNLWVFGYRDGDSAVLKLSPDGELLLRIGERGRPGGDDDTQLLDRATSCYHDVERREVFIADGYGNHRVIAFNSDTGEFTRMWGAYGEKPSSLSQERGFGNPVHKVACGPDGRIYVGDRIKGRVQEFELVPGGARFLREVVVAPGTGGFGSAFDLAFMAGGDFMLVADGTNHRVWTVDLQSFAVLGWSSSQPETEGEINLPAAHGLLHRFTIEPNGDLLLACVTAGFKRMRYSGVA
jgi:sugar lactone lactonase YvrE